MHLAQDMNRLTRRVPTWLVWCLGMAPLTWLAWGLGLALQGQSGPLGVDPVKTLEHETGLLALQFLIAGLAVTPLRRFAGLNLIKFRRALGLIAFTYLLAHIATWAVLDVQAVSRVIEDLTSRTYIMVGMAGFLLLVPLAWTSRNTAIRRLGAVRWRRLHMLVYPAILLGGLHFVMSVKGWPVEPLAYLGAISFLLGLRLLPRRRHASV